MMKYPLIYICTISWLLMACGNNKSTTPTPLQDSLNTDSFVIESTVIDSIKLDSIKMPKMTIDSTDSSSMALKNRLSADTSSKLNSDTKKDLEDAMKFMKKKQHIN